MYPEDGPSLSLDGQLCLVPNLAAFYSVLILRGGSHVSA